MAFGLCANDITESYNASNITHSDKNTTQKKSTRKETPKTAIKMSFEPKTKIELDPPKDDIISLEYLSKCDGKFSRLPLCG